MACTVYKNSKRKFPEGRIAAPEYTYNKMLNFSVCVSRIVQGKHRTFSLKQREFFSPYPRADRTRNGHYTYIFT